MLPSWGPVAHWGVSHTSPLVAAGGPGRQLLDSGLPKAAPEAGYLPVSPKHLRASLASFPSSQCMALAVTGVDPKFYKASDC